VVESVVVKSEKRNHLGDSDGYAKTKLNYSLKRRMLSCILLSSSLSIVCMHCCQLD
jgi:hypothetical protein